ncbi:sensor histidine kinase [Microbaculum marinum]|uniref:histidine kinase n=1 Tax=Microbaculum marinum TaxID=1764581 RepID=A0AAW9RY70_9HYPH
MEKLDQTHFLDGGGEMAEAIRRFDWAQTPLGPLPEWPPALAIAVGMMLNSRFPKCIVWGPEKTAIYNDAFRPILGNKPEPLGKSFKEIWAEAWDTIGPIADKAFAGEATFIEDFPLVIDRFGHPEQAYFTFCYSPIRDEKGNISGMMDTVIETTGKVQAQKHARLLNRELAHRINNTLAMVSAIASQTFRTAKSKDEAKTRLDLRILALGEAHKILTKSQEGTAPIRAVVDNALAPHLTGANEITIEGPPLDLSARHSLALALATNELATNAVKYGALSTDEGKVNISWKVGAPRSSERFVFCWVEEGGPPVRKPRRRGFGSVLVEKALAQDFQGDVKLVYDRVGLKCELTTEMRNLHFEPDDDLFVNGNPA